MAFVPPGKETLTKTSKMLTVEIRLLIASRRRHPALIRGALIREAAQGRAGPSMRQLAVAGWLRGMDVSTLDEEHAKDVWYV